MAAKPAVRNSKKSKWLKQRSVIEALTGYAFILPATLLIGIFGIFPIGYSVYMSLFRWRVRRSRFIGFDNYEALLGNVWAALAFIGGIFIILIAHWLWTDAYASYGKKRVFKLMSAFVLIAAGISIALGWGGMMASGDRRFLSSLVRTLFYALGTVPLQIGLSLVLAYLLFQKIRGQEFFRMLYFLPYITPVVASAVVFRSIFNPRPERLANQVLALFGIPEQRWLFESRSLLELLFGDSIAKFNTWLTQIGVSWQWEGLWLGPSMALVTIILFGVWTYVGYNVIIFLAGLGGIPKNLYEAAEIDGANGVQQFLGITVPLLSPVTFYLTILGFIGTLQAFTHIYVMRESAARDSVDTASIIIFDTFYKLNNYSLAAAQSILLFILILTLTLLQNRILGKRVFNG